jgi:hypothetical protein
MTPTDRPVALRPRLRRRGTHHPTTAVTVGRALHLLALFVGAAGFVIAYDKGRTGYAIALMLILVGAALSLGWDALSGGGGPLDALARLVRLPADLTPERDDD